MWTKIKISGTTKEIYFVFVTFIAFIFLGISRSYLAFLFHQLDSPESIIHLDNEEKSLIAAFTCLLCPIGCLFIGICMDSIGRTYSLVLIYVPMTITWAIVGITPYIGRTVAMLYAAFLIQGISTGMSFCVGNYVSEITIPKHRGYLFAILIINYNLGTVSNSCLMYLLSWNVVAFIFTGLAILTAVLTYFLPESPIWLYMKGRKERSIKTLAYIRNKPAEHLEGEIQDLEKHCSKTQQAGLKQTLKNCVVAWRQLLMLMCLFICAMNSGHSCFTVFGIMILDDLNLPFDSSQILVIYSILGILGCIFAPYFIHRFNRKSVMGVSSFILAISLLIIYIYSTFGHDTQQTYAWIVPTCLFLYSIVANIGVISVSFIISGELFPNESRGVLSGIHGSVGYLYWSAYQKIFPSFLSTFGATITILLFTVCCFILTLFVFFVLPETRGKSLNQIQEEYFPKKTEKQQKEIYTVPVSSLNKDAIAGA